MSPELLEDYLSDLVAEAGPTTAATASQEQAAPHPRPAVPAADPSAPSQPTANPPAANPSAASQPTANPSTADPPEAARPASAPATSDAARPRAIRTASAVSLPQLRAASPTEQPRSPPVARPAAIRGVPAVKDTPGPTPVRPTPTVSWLSFRLGEQPFAIEVVKAQEVLLVPDIVPVRGTDVALLGLINLRGLLVPVLDLAQRLALPSVPFDEHSRVIVLEADGTCLGLKVSAVGDVVAITTEAIETIEPGLLDRGNRFIRGVCRIGVAPTILLSADALLAG